MTDIDYWDVLELACHMVSHRTGEDAEQLAGSDDIDVKFFDLFSIGIEELQTILETLIYFTPTMKSELSQKRYHGFGVQHPDFFESIIKTQVKEQS